MKKDAKPMEPIQGQNIGKELCDALGLQEKEIVGIRLRVDVDKPVTLDVTMRATQDAMPKVIQILKRYHLVEIEDPCDAPERGPIAS